MTFHGSCEIGLGLAHADSFAYPETGRPDRTSRLANPTRP